MSIYLFYNFCKKLDNYSQTDTKKYFCCVNICFCFHSTTLGLSHAPSLHSKNNKLKAHSDSKKKKKKRKKKEKKEGKI